MEAIGCLVPELQSEMRSGCETQLFEKTQCFYVATANFNVSIYYCVSLKVGKDSWERQRL